MSMTTVRKLVVGGGRAGGTRVWDPATEAWYDIPGMPKPRSKAIKLNIDVDARPDVVGDINRAPFANQAFGEVLFESVTWEAFTEDNLGAINEAARVLQPAGRLVIETGGGMRARLPALRRRMNALGFMSIRVTERANGGIRISGRLGES
jgi:SAM-dependent methyltransferase